MGKYCFSKDGKVTTSILDNTEFRAARRFIKRFGFRNFGYPVGDDEAVYQICDEIYELLEMDKLIMPKSYKATVRCSENDEYNAEVGKQEAYDKAVKNYRTGLINALKRWQVAMLFKIFNVSPETFDEAVEKVQAKIASDKSKK